MCSSQVHQWSSQLAEEYKVAGKRLQPSPLRPSGASSLARLHDGCHPTSRVHQRQFRPQMALRASGVIQVGAMLVKAKSVCT